MTPRITPSRPQITKQPLGHFIGKNPSLFSTKLLFCIIVPISKYGETFLLPLPEMRRCACLFLLTDGTFCVILLVEFPHFRFWALPRGFGHRGFAGLLFCCNLLTDRILLTADAFCGILSVGTPFLRALPTGRSRPFIRSAVSLFYSLHTENRPLCYAVFPAAVSDHVSPVARDVNVFPFDRNR